MAFQPVPGVAHVALNQTLHLENIQNNLYFRKSSGEFSLADLELLSDAMANWWIANIAPTVAADLTLRNVVATSLEDAIAPQFTSNAGLPASGTLGTPALPGNVCLCVSFRTGLTGRSARGRNYQGGLSEGSVSGNVVTAGVVAALTVAYQQLLNPVVTEGFIWVVVQRYSEGVQLPSGVARTIASVLVVDSVVDSQRRRLTGRGN